MKNSAKILKYVAIFDLLSGMIFIILAVYLYVSGQKLYNTSGEMTTTFIFMIIGLVFLVNSPIVFFIAKKAEEKHNSPVEY